MATLSTSTSGEVHLTLRGDDENRILATVRRWPYWVRADVERDPENTAKCLSITLVADRLYESVVREILKRSFSMTFPAAGGDVVLPPAPPPSRTSKRRF